MEFLTGSRVDPAITNAPATIPSQRTAIVLGVPNGGTSMVAAVLDALGVYVGDEADIHRAGAFENPAFMSPSDPVRAAEVIRCNAVYDVWGFKNPHGLSVVRRLPDTVRNPYAIAVWRDAVAVTQRWQARQPDTYGAMSFTQVFRKVCKAYYDLREAVLQTGWPCLWTSYERAKTDPTQFVQSVVAFLGLDPTTAETLEAVARISPSGGYCMRSDHALATLREPALRRLGKVES